MLERLISVVGKKVFPPQYLLVCSRAMLTKRASLVIYTRSDIGFHTNDTSIRIILEYVVKVDEALETKNG